MNPTKRLMGVCSECGGSIQFPAELIGTTTTCPRCRKQTELRLESPPEEPSVPRKAIVWTAVAVVILVGGLIASLVALKRFEHLAERQKDPATAAAGAKDGAVFSGLEVSAISLGRGQGRDGNHVVGTVVNASGRRRSQVTLEFDLLDARGQKVGVAQAYRPVFEPGARWEFKLPVAGESKAVSAKVASIKEGR
jgi:hypothetical protein